MGCHAPGLVHGLGPGVVRYASATQRLGQVHLRGTLFFMKINKVKDELAWSGHGVSFRGFKFKNHFMGCFGEIGKAPSQASRPNVCVLNGAMAQALAR